MRINGFSLGWIEIVILAVAVSFLFSLMGKNSCSKGGGVKFLGFVMFMAAIGAVVLAFRTVSHYEPEVVIDHGPIVVDREGEVFYQGIHGAPMQFRSADKRFIEKHGDDLVECSAVFLPPDADGNTLVRVEMNVDPEWRVLTLGKPRDRSVSHTVSQLALAESRGKFVQIDSPHADTVPEIDGPFQYHQGRIVWNAPIQLQRGVDLDELQIKGTVLAQLMKDGVLARIDRMFVAQLDRSAEAFSFDSASQHGIDLHSGQNGSTQMQIEKSNTSTGSNTNTDINTTTTASANSAGQGGDVPPPVAPPTVAQPQSLQQGPYGASPYVSAPATSLYEAYPFNDPAFDAAKDAQSRYSWIKNAPDQRSVESNAFYTTVATDAFYESNRSEMRAQFRERVRERVNEYVDLQLLERGASRHLNLSDAFIQENIIKIEYAEIGDVEIDDLGSEMWTTYGRLVFTPEVNNQIKSEYKNTVIVNRIGFFGAIAGMCLALIGTVYGYFRVDTATKGYYSCRLKWAAIAICILILAAGSGILEEVGRNGF